MKHDEKIKLLLAKVETQKAELGTKPKAVWNTNGIFQQSKDSLLNINACRNTQEFVDALGFLLEKEARSKEAAQRLGVKSTFNWNGYSVTEWETDFKKRIEILNYDAKKQSLEETKKKLNSLVSEEAKTEMELEDIEAMLGK